MKQPETLNGKPIPYDASTQELICMLQSRNMQEFCLACEALSYRTDQRAVSALSSFLNSNDRYRRLYVFMIIYRCAKDIVPQQYLENQLSSNDSLFVNAALRNISEYDLPCDEELLKNTMKANITSCDDGIRSLVKLKKNEDNYQYLCSLLEIPCQSITHEIVTELLIKKYEDDHTTDLVEMLMHSDNPKLRVEAAILACKHGMDTSAFENDPNGHVRNVIRHFSH